MIRYRFPLWVFILIPVVLIIIVFFAHFILSKKKSQDNNKVNPYSTFGEIPAKPDIYEVENKSTQDGLPFFSEQLAQISQIEWQIRYFQPILKSIILKDGGVFLEAEYPNMANEKKTILIFAGGNLEGKLYRFAEIEENRARRYLVDKEDIEKNFPINKRIRVEYLQSAHNLEAGLKSAICLDKQAIICLSAPYINQHETEFLEFFRTGNISPELYLIAISLSKNLNEK